MLLAISVFTREAEALDVGSLSSPDACHLLVRITARQFGHAIPNASLTAPLRFAQVLPTSPQGAFQCDAPGCSTRGGKPRQAAHKCIEYKCKSCCHNAGSSAIQTGSYRDSCKAHGTPGSEGPRLLAQPALPPPPQPQYAPPQPVQPQYAPPQPAHFPPPPAQLQYPPPQVQQAPAGQYHAQPASQIRAPVPSQPRAGPIHGGRGQAIGRPLGRQLANPLSNTWGNKNFGAQDYVDTGKVARQKLDAIVKHTVELAIFHTKNKDALRLQHQVTSYPQMQFSAYPTLMNDLGINESTCLREELEVGDCPNLDSIISQQPRKRTGTALVSPPKKLARTDIASTPAQARHIIEIPDSPPLTPSSILPSTVSASVSTPSAMTRPEPTGKQFPWGFYVIEHKEAWEYYNRLKDSGPISIPTAFSALFPGAVYKNTAVKKYRPTFLSAPKDIVAHFVARGTTPEGLLKVFWDALQAHQRGEPLAFLAPNYTAPPVKTEVLEIPVPPILAIQLPPVHPLAPSEPPPDKSAGPASELCLFCDIPLSVAPSAKLADLRAKLLALSVLTPTPANPEHRVAHMSHQSAAFCKQHKTDSQLLPFARANNLPEYINYAALIETLETAGVVSLLQEILEDLEASEFFAAATSMAENDKFEKSTGYFGELGYTVISRRIKELFPASTITVDHTPLSWEALMERVLIPEALVALITDELQTSPEATIELLHDSTPFGLEYHSDISDRDRCAANAREQATFPSIPSPLLPHELSPLLAPASWERESSPREPSPPPLGNLCSYCDQDLPTIQSEVLLAMEQKLHETSWSDPLDDNPQHRGIPQMRMTVDYCTRHRFERDHLPAGIHAGWPFNPKFSRLFHRILDLGQPLRNMCMNLAQSPFFLAACEYYGDKVTQRSSLGAQFASNRSSEHDTGYYGERGYEILDTTLRFMFPDCQAFVRKFHPLTYNIAIREVLIPEATIRIIQNDLNIEPKEAIVVLKESHTFGLVLHPSEDDCEFHRAAVLSISRSHRRTQWSLRTWEASGTTLDFEAWLQDQKDMEAALAVKLEPVEARIPHGNGLGAEIIDLTGDDDSD
ncbi:hypothetical protein B0H13DRAFT_2289276 [Mycena leptocephala]|nr:hypothetical protein B0H13DRAFT_2289276 [Mycena leptocephala]